MRSEKLTYQHHVRRLLESGVLVADEVVLAHQILSFPDWQQIGWMTYRLLERLSIRGALERLVWRAGDPQTDVRYRDPATNDTWLLHLPVAAVPVIDSTTGPTEAPPEPPEVPSAGRRPGVAPRFQGPPEEPLHTFLGATAKNFTRDELTTSLEPLVHELVARTSADEANVYLVTEPDGELVSVVPARAESATYTFFERQIQSEVLEKREILAVSNPDPQRDRGLPTSIAFLPLTSGTQVVGLLEILRKEAGPFADAELDLFALAAAAAGEIAARARILEELIYVDSLTGLHNRAFFEDQVQREIARVDRVNREAEEVRERLALLIADFDQLKEINDTHGHPAGDAVLRALGQILDTGVRQIDIPARVGGDEFCILLPRSTSQQAVAFTANRLRGLVADARFGDLVPELGETRLTISIGFALYPDDTDPNERQPWTTLVHRADQALLAAKEAGRDRVVSWRDVRL